MSTDNVPPVTPHLGLPLPSPDAPSQRQDVQRIAQALTKLDEAIEDLETLTLALGGGRAW